MGKDFDFGPVENKSLYLGRKCYMCRREEEYVDHIFLHLVICQEYCGSWSSLCLA